MRLVRGIPRLAVAAALAFAAVPADAAAAHAVAAYAAAPVVCAEDVAACDSDGDGVGDLVEEGICGSATCATGAEDEDGNGVPDATELGASLERGGPGGPVLFRDAGMVRVVLPGPSVIDVPWWPAAVLAAGGAGVVSAVVLVRRRNGVRQGDEGGKR